MAYVHCLNCKRPYPETGVPYRCPHCGGLFDFKIWPAVEVTRLQDDRPGIWRFGEALGLPPDAPEISLGEGNTPLVWDEYQGKRVALKCEYLNPTGSFKDRGMATLLSFLRSRGVEAAIEDSSGNAGAAFAAYAARAGVRARVYVPDYAAGPKRRQIEAYGAEVVRILGARSVVAEKARQAAAEGAVYASHAYQPYVLPGYATLAYELYLQLGCAPGSVVLPVGQGGLLLGIGRGFWALQQAGVIDRLPALIGVQAQACAPLWAMLAYGPAGEQWVTEGQTAAEGVRVRRPLRGDSVLRMVSASGGTFLAIEEELILPARDHLAQQGFYVEPTSALAWAALPQILPRLPEPVVVVLTGAGLKHAGA
ncbi:MAG: pyridoxal-phosphate dependent enzyme [Anaerolineae bacterium]|nr:MAG: pyridoxal-phosphate dependent enzyme [Anaerolineae bacterium]